jgi:hypothetical protein
MTCTILQPVLDSYLDGTLSPETRKAVDEHMEYCRRCRELLGIARGEFQVTVPNETDLAESVLRRTAGPACVRTRESLCDFADGTLGGLDLELVAGHLAHCEPCLDLAVALSTLRLELPAMAEVQPDGDFAFAVMRRIGEWAPQRGDRRRGFSDWWLAMVRRPRFSLEVAYLGTLLLVVVFGNPLAPSYGSLRLLGRKEPTPMVVNVPRLYHAWTGTVYETLSDLSATGSRCTSAVHQLASRGAAAVAGSRGLPVTLFGKTMDFCRRILKDLRLKHE